MVTPTGPEPFPGGGFTTPWATVEQDPSGLWWTSTDDATTTGPYLDEVQALRAAHTYLDEVEAADPHTWDPTQPAFVVHTTTPNRPTINHERGA